MTEIGATQTASAVLSVNTAPGADWDAFVGAQAQASIYHRSGWSLLARDVFGHRAFFVEARAVDGSLQGVLPLVQQRSLIGNFATSIPFFNYGGAVSRSIELDLLLMRAARDHAEKLGCAYLELRDAASKAADDWQVRTDKVSMILQLPPTMEQLGKQLGSKLRSQVKRAERESAEVSEGGLDLLDAFYEVFAENMRDLGTPVYPKRFFAAILQRFAAQTSLLVLKTAGRPAAAGFLVFDGQRAEIPWACCSAAAKPLGMNMKLYWEVLRAVMARGCTTFDFGRSTVDSGTYRFKKQWGAEPLQLHWHRWERGAKRNAQSIEAGGGMSSGRLMRYATAAWRHLPLPVANVLGPIVSPGLPW